MVSPSSLSRRRFLLGSAGITAFALFTSRSLDAVARSTGVRIVNSDGLRLRSAPGLGSSTITSLALGTAVNYLGAGGYVDGYDWSQVEVRATGTVGYVASQYLSTPDEGGFAIGSMVHVDTVGGGGANLRSAPGTSASVVAVVSNGTTGTIEDGPSQADGYTWYKVFLGDVTGWMATVVLAEGGGSDRSYVQVIDGPLNVRQDPGLNGAIIASVSTGATGFVTTDMPQEANGYVWINVEFDNGIRGWVAQDFVASI
jgi:uncharacterized protein YgiM (DUF1202 family)